MIRNLTQTVTACAENGWAGNCWQTAIACLLNIDPDVMPPQAAYDLYDTNPDGTKGERRADTKYYDSALQPYLRKHHGLHYYEMHVPSEGLPFLRVADPGWHLMTGRTVRTAGFGGLRHVVVGRYGECAWDPHPSHAGLTDQIHWAFLIQYPELWIEDEKRRGVAPAPCVCPSCAAQRTAA